MAKKMIIIHPVVAKDTDQLTALEASTGMCSVVNSRHGMAKLISRTSHSIPSPTLPVRIPSKQHSAWPLGTCTRCAVRTNMQNHGATCSRCKRGVIITGHGGNAA